MSPFEFCEHSHPFWGRSGASSGPQGKEVDLKLCTRGGLRGTPLGLLPPHNNRQLPNNSKIKDFYRANKKLFFVEPRE
jgi:hypothetical protein